MGSNTTVSTSPYTLKPTDSVITTSINNCSLILPDATYMTKKIYCVVNLNPNNGNESDVTLSTSNQQTMDFFGSSVSIPNTHSMITNNNNEQRRITSVFICMSNGTQWLTDPEMILNFIHPTNIYNPIYNNVSLDTPQTIFGKKTFYSMELNTATVENKYNGGGFLLHSADGSPWTISVDNSGQLSLPSSDSASKGWIVFNETQPVGTNGGTFSTGQWRTRVLNTTVGSSGSTGVTLSGNQLTFPAGTYKVQASAPACRVGSHKTRLHNITAGTTLQVGSTEYCGSSATLTSNSQTVSVVNNIFTLSGTTVIELQHRCQTTRATDGFGMAAGFAESEIYSQVCVAKLA
jgi:hypothetical protein